MNRPKQYFQDCEKKPSVAICRANLSSEFCESVVNRPNGCRYWVVNPKERFKENWDKTLMLTPDIVLDF